MQNKVEEESSKEGIPESACGKEDTMVTQLKSTSVVGSVSINAIVGANLQPPAEFSSIPNTSVVVAKEIEAPCAQKADPSLEVLCNKPENKATVPSCRQVGAAKKRSYSTTGSVISGRSTQQAINALQDRSKFKSHSDWQQRHLSLSPEIFKSIFNMDKEAFSALPVWKQEQKRNAVGLW